MGKDKFKIQKSIRQLADKIKMQNVKIISLFYIFNFFLFHFAF